MNYYLFIDTSTDFTIIALADDEKIISKQISDESYKQSEYALPFVANLLAEEKIATQQLKAIYLGVGPGSFTGTRVGVSIAKTISYVHNIPIQTFCSLLCFMQKTCKPYAIATDAKNRKCYLLEVSPTKPPLDLKPILVETDKLKFLSTHMDIFSPDLYSKFLFTKKTEPNIELVIKSCTEILKNSSPKDVNQVEVLYLRECHEL